MASDTATATNGPPPPLSLAVSAQMRRMPRSSTKPELELRRALHARGLRFRIQVRGLPGRPDIVLSRARIAIFVDGCFWHACPDHGVMPRNNREWWRRKLAANVERDRRKDAALEDMGWQTIHVWEHEDVEPAAEMIIARWRQRTGRSEMAAPVGAPAYPGGRGRSAEGHTA